MSALFGLVKRDLRLAMRQSADAALVLVFFLLGVLLFPFGVGPEPGILARIGAGVIWVMALLAALLSLDRLFHSDCEDGSLDLLVLLPLPLELVALAKVVAHWLVTGLPLAVAAPILGTLLNLPAPAIAVLVTALLLGTPILSLVGAIGAALTLGARRAGALLPLLVLPLYIPVLIFGVAAVEAAAGGLPPQPHLLLLAGLLLGALALAPWAAAAALRQALD